MLLDELVPTLRQYWPALLGLAAVLYLLSNKFHNGLNKYPGPLLAAYTDWWRLFTVWSWRVEFTHIALHRKRGDIVRLGPNSLSFGNPQAIKQIYGLNKGFVKSEFYPVQQAMDKDGARLQSLFSTTWEDYHARYRRCVNGAFSMSSLVSYEPLMDSTMDYFLDRTQKLFADTGRTCDFTRWLQFFAFDVVGEFTWSKRLGFLEKNDDVDGIIDFLANFFSYAALVGQIPFFDVLLNKNPIKRYMMKLGFYKKVFPVTLFALSRADERADEMAKIREYGLPEKTLAGDNGRGVDLMTKFTQAQHDHPDVMTDKQVLTSCTSMVFAGSDTTAISLSSTFYFMLRHPRVLRKLYAEIDQAVRDGVIADRPNGAVSWSESQRLRYLDAVIQESFRMHPAVGLPLERIVPPQGVEICGEHIPGGTIVGVSPWVIHRRADVFGANPDEYRPERWLEVGPEKLKEMKGCMLQFGAGSRTCIGKNISLLELYKLVPSVLRRFEVSPNFFRRTCFGLGEAL
ncbi:putative P450 monooxygenase [Lineolata rhizophorae]|uniref:Putative P450 monooxygenase n=1 Tax=Lineolata rhizophorae TaxID=578093 RepID=A0A6A6NWN0_9PEZI|nr:putative P450 monooxygenase [Lineolata rhizophorae]